jgi:hypothetical protein
MPAVDERLERQRTLMKETRDRLLEAQQRQASNANKHRRDVTLNVGDEVLVDARVLRGQQLETSRKLAHRWIGPFRIKRVVSRSAYELDLPVSSRAHPVFNISRLRPYQSPTQFPRRPVPRPPPAIETSDGTEYEVEAIVAKRVRRGKREYLVKWLGYDAAENTWEPEDHLTNSSQLIRAFERRSR